MTKNITVHARISTDLKRKLEFLASRSRRTESDVIRLLIEKARLEDLAVIYDEATQ